MRASCCFALICTCALFHSLCAVEITTDSVIILPEKATVFEKQAAQDFNKVFAHVCGKALPVQNSAAAGQSAVYIGDTQASKAIGVCSANLKNEGEVICTVKDGVVINGGVQGGVIFAVYDFFRTYADCEWYDGWTVKLPKRNSIVLPDNASFKQSPAFEFRKIFTVATGCDWREKDYTKALHGSDWNTDLILGRPGFVHNFHLYTRSWSKKKLKLFAMNEKGKRALPRDSMGPNFCLSNPECRQLIEAQLREWIKTDEDDAARKGISAPYYYFIDANDCTDYFCLCPACKKEAEQYGYSGQLIRFLNPIAQNIARDYPHIRLGTNAYTFTMPLPKGGVVPEKNINIRLSHTIGEFYRPITEDRSSNFMDVVRNWSKLASMLSVWDYWIFYWDEYSAPYTNLLYVAKDLRFYKEQSVKALFIESEAWETSNFFSLRLWLGYRLMFNPDADTKKLIHDYMQGSFGKGAPYVEEYLYYLDKRQAEMPAEKSFAIFRQKAPYKDRPYLDKAFFDKSDALFHQAEVAAAGDELALKNIRRERMIVDCAMLHLWDKRNIQGNYAAVLTRYEAEVREHIAFRVAKDSQVAALAVLNAELGKLRNASLILKQKQQPLPTMNVPNSTSWEKCTRLTQWFEHQGYPSKENLTLELRHDNQMLWVRITDSNVSRKLRSTPQLWDGDECEIMLTAQKDRKEVFHLLIDCEKKHRIYIHDSNDKLDALTDHGYILRSVVSGKSWTVEVGIPRKAIPGTGNTLYGNFFRSANGAKSAQCWSPVFGSHFFSRKHFGKVTLE